MSYIDWYRDQHGGPLRFTIEVIRQAFGFGVYVILEIATGKAVRVGQGDINDRLGRHYNDPEIRIAAYLNPLGVTWAHVDPRDVDGVERYLGDTLRPKVGSHFPNAVPIEVNLPAGVVRAAPTILDGILASIDRANPTVPRSPTHAEQARSPLRGLLLDTWPGRKTT